MTPVWTILVATLGQRNDNFVSLMGSLLPQTEPHDGRVTVQAFWNNGERPLGYVRQDLVEHAVATYVSFVDDDDEVHEEFVNQALPRLDGQIDYLGWRMQCVHNGELLAPTYHSLVYGSWWEDKHGYYRDISHLNPTRRELALQHASFCPKPGLPLAEDHSWAEQLRGHLKTEDYVGDDVIMYRYNCWDAETTWRGGAYLRPGWYRRPQVVHPNFSWHPASQESGYRAAGDHA